MKTTATGLAKILICQQRTGVMIMADIQILMKDIDSSVNIGSSMAVDSPESCKDIFANLDQQTKILSQNIRSINHNFDDLQALISRFDIDFDIIVLTECWLTENTFVPTIPGYNITTSNRHINQNDGIVLYIKSDLAFKTTEPIECQEANCLVSTLGVEYAIISIYRPPSFRNTDNFTSSLDQILSNLKNYKNVIVLGDMNINIINDSCDHSSTDYLDMLTSHGLLPSHTLPTRGQNCLDHCMIKTILPNVTAVCNTSVTDHSSVILSIAKNGNHKIHQTRTYKKTDYHAVISELEQINWISVLNSPDVNDATNLFLYLVNRTIKKYTNLVKISRRKINIKPWITPGLIRCLKNRDKLHQKLKKMHIT